MGGLGNPLMCHHWMWSLNSLKTGSSIKEPIIYPAFSVENTIQINQWAPVHKVKFLFSEECVYKCKRKDEIRNITILQPLTK